MAQITVYPNGNATVTLTAGQNISVKTSGVANIYQQVGYPNLPAKRTLLSTVTNGIYTSSTFAAGATLIVENSGASPAFYETGTSAFVSSAQAFQNQGTPVALDATGTLTAAAILGGIVTSSTAAAVTATLDTGTVVDAATNLAIGDSFDWSVINTGGANAITVTASAGHTIVGAGAVLAAISGVFRTRKTAAATFITYRIG